ncbi:hypothetical protein LEMLEM_LOCUS3014 [Lemmus lemmus]
MGDNPAVSQQLMWCAPGIWYQPPKGITTCLHSPDMGTSVDVLHGGQMPSGNNTSCGSDDMTRSGQSSYN